MPTPTALVVKSNALIPAMAKLGLMELRLLAFCIAHIQQQNMSFEPVTAAAKEIASLYEMPLDRTYSLIKEVMININSKPAEYMDGNRKTISVWFTTISYHEGEGLFTFHINQHLSPYLLGLKDNFTAYRLKDVYQFKSASAWHIYEILRQHKYIGKVEFYLEKFKALVGVSGNYPRFNNLKLRLIDPAIVEINEKSDIDVQYELIKHGVKVTGLRFFIAKNKDTMTPAEKVRQALSKGKTPNNNPEFARLLREEYRMAPAQAKQLANLVDHNGQEPDARALLPKLRKRYEALANRKTALGGYVFRALRDELTQGNLQIQS